MRIIVGMMHKRDAEPMRELMRQGRELNLRRLLTFWGLRGRDRKPMHRDNDKDRVAQQ